jgi:uncharacterized protein
MTERSTFALITSKYNFFIPVEDNAVLFNAISGMILRFNGHDAEKLARILCLPDGEISEEEMGKELFNNLKIGGFLISEGFNELDDIRRRFFKVRRQSPIIFTITVTADCNLNCYYCYEKRSKDMLYDKDIPAIVSLARQQLENNNKNSLHVDWYGGEPFLNIAFIEECSLALQKLCEEKGSRYSASIISNGTCWPEDAEDFIRRHRINQVQITFDGLADNHNKRRVYSKAYEEESSNSFEKAIKLVDSLLNYVHVDIRLNIDPDNAADAVPFIRFVKDRGWFEKKFKPVIFPAKLTAITEKAAYMREIEISPERFHKIQAEIAEAVRGDAIVKSCGMLSDSLKIKNSVCAALAFDSLVIGADRQIYRCGLQVCEKQNAVGSINNISVENGVENKTEAGLWWENFDPSSNERCSACSFLPLCWGGCPKAFLENNTQLIKEQCDFWLENLPALIAESAGIKGFTGFRYDEAFQFRAMYASV